MTTAALVSIVRRTSAHAIGDVVPMCWGCDPVYRTPIAAWVQVVDKVALDALSTRYDVRYLAPASYDATVPSDYIRSLAS